MFSQKLLSQIRRVALELPFPTLESIINSLENYQERGYSEGLKGELFQRLPKASWRQAVGELVEIWRTQAPHLDSSSIAIALATAASCEKQTQQELSLEVVWTGPNVSDIALRRTDQVLLQLIQDARQELLLVSFAIYKVPEIATALIAAINRGVRLRIVAETPDSSNGKIPFGVSAAFGTEVTTRAQVFVWPREQRPTDSEGRSGSLHVKCAIADSTHLFISSANLTEYALAINMEMGLLVHSQNLAHKVIKIIDQLICQGILVAKSKIL